MTHRSLIQFLSFAIALAIFSGTLGAAEIREGRMKLVLHENTGRFSLYYLSDIKKERYDALFVDQDPRTSFLAVLVDDKAYRLGESTVFRFRIRTDSAKPAIVYESTFLSVTQEFSFIKSEGSSLADGVRMDVVVANRGERQTPVGLRVLLDTKLGEGSAAHFHTDRRAIKTETLVAGSDSDRWWFSKTDSVGLMGNIAVPGVERPDSVHMANWKRLNDAPWKVSPSQGRNFNMLPYSVGDSAVCYYYDPISLARGGERTVSLLLAAANEAGFGSPSSVMEDDVSRILRESAEAASSPELSVRTDLITLRDLIDRIDRALAAGGAVSEEELAAMETAFARMKERHGDR